jgi:hypothetical protein
VVNFNTRLRLFLAGAVIVVVASILAASIEGLAYVTHWTTIFGPASSTVLYYPMTLGFHSNSWVFVVCGFGGVLGLLYSVTKRQISLALASISITSLGLLLPFYIARIKIPESQDFNLPWIGSYLILAGLSLMILSLISSMSWIRLVALPFGLLIAAYAAYPVFILTNSLPYITLEPKPIAVYTIVWACTFAFTLALLSLAAYAYKKNALQWIKEKEN